MRFGSEIHDRLRPVHSKQIGNQCAIADVAFDENVIVIVVDAVQLAVLVDVLVVAVLDKRPMDPVARVAMRIRR